MISPNDIIKRVHITEKGGELSANLNKYTFEVYSGVNRTQVATAIEKLYEVKVATVNILNRKGKVKQNRLRRTKASKLSDRKFAIVTLEEGSSIELV